MLRKIEIKKLFNTKDITINLKTGVNIFVGENGSGKTTILNLINSFLTLDLKSIIETMFESVTFYFSKHQVSFNLRSLKDLFSSVCVRRRYYDDRYFDRRRDYVNSMELQKIGKILKAVPHDDWPEIMKIKTIHNLRNYIVHQPYYSCEDIEDIDYHYLDILTNLSNETANNLIKLLDLQGYLDSEVLYFPTFRRIETDLSHFNLSDEAVKQITFSKNLNFGMGDVEKLLESKLKIIDTSIRQGFNKMTTTLLRQYVNNDDLYLSKINDEELKVILNILSDSLPETLVVKIEDMMKTDKIYTENNEQLLNLLNCLMKIYEEQECNISCIEKFVDVCNKYFCNKSLLFKKDSLSVEILDNDNQIIQFSNLSSGEKQMVSIFSKLYLETEKKYFILFDEPELSLSIEWQRMLIPDIMNAECVNQLLAVTHSPFIFDNQYDKNAKSL